MRPTATLDLEPGAGSVAVEADRGLLLEVIHELVENASEALRDDGGVITVRSQTVTDKGSPWWELEVKDNGVGMDSEMVARVFDPFYSTKPQRHGLGLSAVLGIVHRLGGEIHVTSQPDLGATFRVRVPVVPGVAPLRRRGTSEQLPIESLAGLRILVADDEPSVRTTIQRLLARRRAKPTIVADGAQAEAALHEGEFDLVLLDVRMPKRTGYQLVPIARVTQPGVPVLLMSGYSEQARAIEPPDGFLEKPFNGAMLEAAIKAVLQGENGNGQAGSDNG
jgi:CheY-like chemotaxis protein